MVRCVEFLNLSLETYWITVYPYRNLLNSTHLFNGFGFVALFTYPCQVIPIISATHKEWGFVIYLFGGCDDSLLLADVAQGRGS